ncbi:galactose oxidase [Lichtheimia hyalospora FSU 10163]|nr:galactose oxidase [Lichtheimia hyalospora FSU 10163]
MPSATTSTAMQQMQSISGITTQIQATSGQVPPPLVGASISVVDDRVFVFAGRLVSSRQMTNYMYVLDLHTLEWTRHIPPPDSAKAPRARYFHSANVYNNTIVIFGGMGTSRMSQDNLCVLDDVSIFDVSTMSWKRPTVEPSLFAPRPRYAHLASVIDDKLVVMGGQNIENAYLHEINVLDMSSWEWIHARTIEQHVGTYRSIAVAAPPGTRLPASTPNNEITSRVTSPDAMTTISPNNTGAGANGNNDSSPSIYVYSNYNFTDVQRELQVIRSPLGTGATVEDCTHAMAGTLLPPGLRFPSGHSLGHHVVICGTHLSPQSQTFSIWALDLGTLAWSRIETGTIFSRGSWNCGTVYPNSNRALVFGHRERHLMEDYNHRQLNFDHMATIDLEAFGVYRVPENTCSTLAQEMGLSLLNEPTVCDFRIVSSDGRSIPVNSAVLSQRWSYFEQLMETRNTRQRPEGTTYRTHSLSLPYPYPVVIALLQFLYTDHLITAQQYQPHILAQLLLLADMYSLDRLRLLATHALHQMLNMATAPLIFETAALSHQTSLQVRALKMMIAAKKMIQQQQQQQAATPTTTTIPLQSNNLLASNGTTNAYPSTDNAFSRETHQRLLQQHRPASPSNNPNFIQRSASVSSAGYFEPPTLGIGSPRFPMPSRSTTHPQQHPLSPPLPSPSLASANMPNPFSVLPNPSSSPPPSASPDLGFRHSPSLSTTKPLVPVAVDAIASQGSNATTSDSDGGGSSSSPIPGAGTIKKKKRPFLSSKFAKSFAS